MDFTVNLVLRAQEFSAGKFNTNTPPPTNTPMNTPTNTPTATLTRPPISVVPS